jgi:hypothetical protein
VRGKLGALAVVGGLATVLLTGNAAHAETWLYPASMVQGGSYNDLGRTGQYQFQLGDEDGYGWEQSIVWVSGQDGGQDLAKCFRGNGGTAWYESTIVARNGTNSSHYDCSNNSTYNEGLAQVGVDLHP